MLGRVDRAGNSNEFAACMLRIIRNALKEISERQGQNVVINVVTIEETILALLKQDGKHTAKTLSLTLGLTERQVQRLLAKLKENRQIVRHGSNKSGIWEVAG